MPIINYAHLLPRGVGALQGDSTVATSLFRPTDGRIAYWWLRIDRTYLKPVFTKLEDVPVPSIHAPARDIDDSDDDGEYMYVQSLVLE